MARMDYGIKTTTPGARVSPMTGPTSKGSGALSGGTSKPKPPPMANLINQQPLPPDLTSYYAQQQAMLDAQMKAMSGYGGQMAQMQQQLNRGYAADPTGRYMQQLLGLYQGDPFAAERAKMNEMMQPKQRLSRLVYGYGY